jgi:hypothetical protein
MIWEGGRERRRSGIPSFYGAEGAVTGGTQPTGDDDADCVWCQGGRNMAAGPAGPKRMSGPNSTCES